MTTTPKLRKAGTWLLITSIAVLAVTGAIGQAEAEGTSDPYRYPAPRTEEQLREFWKQSSPEYITAPFTRQAVYAPAYSPAETTPAYFGPGLKLLNYLRYAIGLEGSVTLDAELSRKAQLTADLRVLGDGISKKPAAWSDSQYKEASAGTYDGFVNSLYGPHALDQGFHYWAIKNNLQSFSGDVSRMLLLSPELARIGFGLGNVNDNGAILASRTNVDLSRSGTAAYDIVPYPGRGLFPAELFYPNNPWSVMMNRSTFDIPDTAAVTVTLMRTNEGQTWTMTADDNDTTFIPVIDSGAYLDVMSYEEFHMIMFRPGQVRSINGGDEYTVQVNGVKNKAGDEARITYQVKFANTDSVPRNFPELPYEGFGGVAILRDIRTGEPLMGVNAELYRQESRIIRDEPGLRVSEPVGEPVLAETVTSNNTGALVITSTQDASYSIQFLSRSYAPDMSYGLEVKEGHPDVSFLDMYKLAGWGKALTSDGQPIEGMGMLLTDSKGKSKRTVTNRLGEYGFPDLIKGERYKISVFSYPQQSRGIGSMQQNVSFTYKGEYMQFPTARFKSVDTAWKGKGSLTVDGQSVSTASKQPLVLLGEDHSPLVQAKAVNSYLTQPYRIEVQKAEIKLTLGRGTKYTMNTGSTMFVKDGSKTDMGARPEIINGTLYVPLLFYAEALDYNIAADWNKGTVRLTKINM